MEKIQVLIVEDELIIAEDMKDMLTELNYNVTGIATDYLEASEMLGKNVPDIALLDIHLRGNEDGIQLAMAIREKYDIPVVFISSYSDKATVERARLVKPEGYILKPFTREDLYTSIEIALFSHTRRDPLPDSPERNREDSAILKDHIFIRMDYMLVKIRFDELMWIKSEQNYLELHCLEAKHLIRSTLMEFMDKLPAETFLQVHKSFCINLHHITAIDHGHIWLKKSPIPIGRSFFGAVRKVTGLDI